MRDDFQRPRIEPVGEGERSGLWRAAGARAMICVHKEHIAGLDDVADPASLADFTTFAALAAPG